MTVLVINSTRQVRKHMAPFLPGFPGLLEVLGFQLHPKMYSIHTRSQPSHHYPVYPTICQTVNLFSRITHRTCNAIVA